MDRGAWWVAVHGVAKSPTRLSDFAFNFHFPLSCIGEGNGNPLQCSCLGNPRDREAWWAAVYGVAQSQTQLKQLSSSSSSFHWSWGLGFPVSWTALLYVQSLTKFWLIKWLVAWEVENMDFICSVDHLTAFMYFTWMFGNMPFFLVYLFFNF